MLCNGRAELRQFEDKSDSEGNDGGGCGGHKLAEWYMVNPHKANLGESFGVTAIIDRICMLGLY